MRHSAMSVYVFMVLAVVSATTASAAELGPAVGATFPHELAAPDQTGNSRRCGHYGRGAWRSSPCVPPIGARLQGPTRHVNRHFARFWTLD